MTARHGIYRAGSTVYKGRAARRASRTITMLSLAVVAMMGAAVVAYGVAIEGGHEIPPAGGPAALVAGGLLIHALAMQLIIGVIRDIRPRRCGRGRR
jgi:hypothetical protein